MHSEHCTIAIIGGGTAGLALAAELMRLSAGKVVVLERESDAGGIPRHCGHYPFGLREYGWLMKGPDYARRNRERAAKLGADIRTGTTVTALLPGGVLETVGQGGRSRLSADRVVICTGVRESSRSQRFIGGQRPMGVITTGALQSMVYLKGIAPFKRPVILGSELVSFSAIQTCAHLGIKPVAIVEEEDVIRARSIVKPYLTIKGVPLIEGVKDPVIHGRDRVEALTYIDQNGIPGQIETDGVIISGRFRSESALLRDCHLLVDPGTGGPVVDQFGRCSDPAYFATGNVLRPAETSGFCWREGLRMAHWLADDLGDGGMAKAAVIPVHVADPAIGFVVPQRVRLVDQPGGMDSFYVGLKTPVKGTVQARDGANLLWQGALKARPIRRIQLQAVEACRTAAREEITFSMAEKS